MDKHATFHARGTTVRTMRALRRTMLHTGRLHRGTHPHLQTLALEDPRPDLDAMFAWPGDAEAFAIEARRDGCNFGRFFCGAAESSCEIGSERFLCQAATKQLLVQVAKMDSEPSCGA